MSEERKEILGVLTESGELLSPGEVADALGKPRNTVKQRLWRMAQGGQVESHDGKYGMTHNRDNRVTDETGAVIRLRRLSVIRRVPSPSGASTATRKGPAATCATGNWRIPREAPLEPISGV